MGGFVTPLARDFFSALTLPLAARPPQPNELLRHHDDLHCFDCSRIYETIDAALCGRNFDDVLECVTLPFFLPSPVTWIEVRGVGPVAGGGAWLLIADDTPSGQEITIHLARPYGDVMAFTECMKITEVSGKQEQWINSALNWDGLNSEQRNQFGLTAMVMVDVINTPSIVELRAKTPKKSFARKMRHAGHYPLKAWHEVRINRDRIVKVKAGDSAGGKCLHFVRSHRRHYQDGRETVVRAHWRGDPSLGIERTRYKVQGSI